MKLSVKKAIPLFSVFANELDGYDVVIKDKEGKNIVVRTLYQLGAIRLDIAINANRLRPMIEAFDKARMSLIKEITGGKDTLSKEDNPDGWDRYLREGDVMQNQEEEIELKPIKRSALRLDSNPVSVPALMLLEEAELLTD